MKRLMKCSQCRKYEDDDEGAHVGPHSSMFICKNCWESQRFKQPERLNEKTSKDDAKV